MSKEIIATWSWNPHDELPKDQVRETGFPTPVLEAVRFTADNRYVFVQRIPGYDSDVMLRDKPVRVPDEWREWRGAWDISKGKLEMQAADAQWAAQRRENGWAVAGGNGSVWERSFRIIDLEHSRLQLEAIAIGDFDRAFHRANAMPERPAPGSEPR